MSQIKPPYGYQLVTDPNEKKQPDWMWLSPSDNEWFLVNDYDRVKQLTYVKPIPAPPNYELVTDMEAVPQAGWIPVQRGSQCNPLRGSHLKWTVGQSYKEDDITWFKPITQVDPKPTIITQTTGQWAAISNVQSVPGIAISPVIDPGEGYRLLQVGERAVKGDEWLNDKGEWERLTLGFRIDGPGQHYRRKIEPSNTRTAPNFDGYEFVRWANSHQDCCVGKWNLYALSIYDSLVTPQQIEGFGQIWKLGYIYGGGPLYRKVEVQCPHCNGTGKVQG